MKKCTAVRNIDRICFDNNRVFSVFIFLSLQFKYNVQPYMLIKLYCLIPFQNFKMNTVDSLLTDTSIRRTPL